MLIGLKGTGFFIATLANLAFANLLSPFFFISWLIFGNFKNFSRLVIAES
jgi:hypothetical protein